MGQQYVNLCSADIVGHGSTNALDAVIQTMMRFNEVKYVWIQIWGCRLLWNLFSLEDSFLFQDEDVLSIIVGTLLQHLEQIIRTSDHRGSYSQCISPLALHESVICLLSKISLFLSHNQQQEMNFYFVLS